MKRVDGEPRSDYDLELDNLILDLLDEKNALSPYKIKEILNKRYSRKLGWITIKRHLDWLMEKKIVALFYESEDENKKLRLYMLSK